MSDPRGHATPFAERLEDLLDPMDACERLAGLPGRLLLDSCGVRGRLGRHSFLTADPVSTLILAGGIVERRESGNVVASVRDGDYLEEARGLLAPHRRAPASGLPPFQGGLAGFFGYELGYRLDTLPPPRARGIGAPDAWLGLYDWVVAWDHASGGAWLISTGLPGTGREADERALQRLRWVKDRLASAPSRRDRASMPPVARAEPVVETYPVASHHPRGSRTVRSVFSRDGYLRAVERVVERIRAGEIFQANLSQRLEAPLSSTPWSFYRHLRSASPAPFAAYLETETVTLASVSPERLLTVDDGRVETRPIKGTRPRAADPAVDRRLALDLLASEKDRAENVMIVDLLRNDLSRVCEPGSVTAAELLALETHPTVHHLVSTVRGRLEAGKDAFDLLRAAFPGGSVTGAPKLRAMEIIAEEEPVRRGPYCGSAGYLSVTGPVDTSILIRTGSVARNRVYFGAGGGIVADSDPASEYAETMDKAAAFVAALGAVPER